MKRIIRRRRDVVGATGSWRRAVAAVSRSVMLTMRSLLRRAASSARLPGSRPSSTPTSTAWFSPAHTP